MKYASASISASYESSPIEVIDLESVDSENALVDHLWAAFGFAEEDEDGNFPDRDSFAGNIVFTDPQGFAVHLFKEHTHVESTHSHCSPVANFDDTLEAWSDETDDDRREAMGEYLDDMGADDLSDFDEAYQGQHASGADFAQTLCEELGSVPKDFPSWIAIDWDQTWNGGLRFDYHITDSGNVFRHM